MGLFVSSVFGIALTRGLTNSMASIQDLFRLYRLRDLESVLSTTLARLPLVRQDARRRRDGEDGRGHPAPRQGAFWPLGTPAEKLLLFIECNMT